MRPVESAQKLYDLSSFGTAKYKKDSVDAKFQQNLFVFSAICNAHDGFFR